ncbi:MAG: plasmid mobilization relaxosome protein MobC [Ruminococcus sp.]|nr:plasmid mobilization relaxosome protein MobC [Ruminococcus sp.]
MKEKIKRTRSVQVRLSQEEYDFLEQKFQLSGYKSESEFMRIAFFDTLIVKFSTEDMQELLRLVRSISNNVNQIAVRVNSTDKVYVEDMNNIKDGVEKIWQQLRYFQSQLRSVKQ